LSGIVNTGPNPPSASDHSVIREGLLRDFYDHFETKFAEIWKLLKGGTDKSLVGALSKDDVALRISEIVAPTRRRYDANAFKERQKELIPTDGPLPDWVISGGESGGGARPAKRPWIRDVITDCRERDIAPFHKQWGVYQNNPLVVNEGKSVKEAKGLDKLEKGGCLVDGKFVWEFPVRRNAANRDAA
jgi:hypothetical protein